MNLALHSRALIKLMLQSTSYGTHLDARVTCGAMSMWNRLLLLTALCPMQAAAQAPAFDLYGFKLGMSGTQAVKRLDIIVSGADIKEASDNRRQLREGPCPRADGMCLGKRGANGIGALLSFRDGASVNIWVMLDRFVYDSQTEVSSRVAWIKMNIRPAPDTILLTDLNKSLTEKFPLGRSHTLIQGFLGYTMMLAPSGSPSYTQFNSSAAHASDLYEEQCPLPFTWNFELSVSNPEDWTKYDASKCGIRLACDIRTDHIRKYVQEYYCRIADQLILRQGLIEAHSSAPTTRPRL